MKIELKHLAPYLPYGLKFKVLEGVNKDYIMTLDGLSLEPEGDSMMLDHMLCGADHCHYKPIMRPLSDLTKEIEHNGEEIVPIDILEWNSYEHIIKSGKCTSVSYSYMIQLFEWHFDVFGLIEKGLAIDINTLEIQS